MSKTPLFKQSVPLLPENLKSYFQQNDFSTNLPNFDFNKGRHVEMDVYDVARKRFLIAREKQFKVLVNRGAMLNY